MGKLLVSKAVLRNWNNDNLLTILQQIVRNCGLFTVQLFVAAVDCGEPPIIENGTLRYMNTTYKSTVRYRCDYNYIMVDGEAYIRCQENGEWESPPQCEYFNLTLSREEYERLWVTSTQQITFNTTDAYGSSTEYGK